MTLTTRLSRLFSMVQSRSASGRSTPRLDARRLSSHDLADLNLPPAYRAQVDFDRSFEIPGHHR